MNTFLIDKDFEKTALVLDNRRLNKQVLEACQIFNILVTNNNVKNSTWKHHPAVLMWKGYEYALFLYIKTMHKEWKKRTKVKCDHGGLSLLPNIKLKYSIPFWFNDKRIYSSHRSKLLFKGEVDGILNSLSRYEMKIYKYYYQKYNLPEKRYRITYSQKEILKEHLILLKLKFTNWYKLFNWKEDDKQEYFWPVSIKEIDHGKKRVKKTITRS